MTPLQAFVTVLCALIAVAGVITSAILGYKQFSIKRNDELQEKAVQKRIDEAVAKAKEEMLMELEKVSMARSEEGAERFNKHAASIVEINRQIEQNSKQISELTSISKNVLESMDSLNKVVRASADSQKNSNYDRILFVTNKVLKSQKITITDKTNLKQLYESWVALHGENEPLDPKIMTMYEECMKFTPVPDEG